MTLLFSTMSSEMGYFGNEGGEGSFCVFAALHRRRAA
jgi:hypothetical protein